MNDLFNRKDILTIATADKAVIGTKGFFGDNLEEIIDAVKRNKIRTLSDVDMLATYNFWSNEEMNYMFFLPLDKVNNVKKSSYRQLNNIDELFNFLVPDFDANTCDTDRKVEILLGKKYQVKDKTSGAVYFVAVSEIYFKDDILGLDGKPLNYFFEHFEIKKNGEWVPFGIMEKRNKKNDRNIKRF